MGFCSKGLKNEFETAVVNEPSVFETLKFYCITILVSLLGGVGGWGGAMVLGKLPVPGRPTSLENSRARAYCACSWCGRGWFGYFFSHLLFLSSFSLSLGDGPIQTEILSQRAVKPKTTNQP